MIPLMMQENYQPKGWRKFRYQVLRLVFDVVAMFLTWDHSAGSGPDHGHEVVV